MNAPAVVAERIAREFVIRLRYVGRDHDAKLALRRVMSHAAQWGFRCPEALERVAHDEQLRDVESVTMAQPNHTKPMPRVAPIIPAALARLQARQAALRARLPAPIIMPAPPPPKRRTILGGA